MFEMPRFEMPEIEVVDLTVAQLKAMSDGELLKLLSGESDLKGMIPLPLQQLITSELLARGLAKASKPHWSVVPSFWMLIATVLLALAGVVVAILALPQTQQIIQPTTPIQAVAPAKAVSSAKASQPQQARRRRQVDESYAV
jgi:UPF0716 family protein affecting phage T7 exclusion